MKAHEQDFEPIPPKQYGKFHKAIAIITAVALLAFSLHGIFYLINLVPKRGAVKLAGIQTFIPPSIKEPFTSYSPDQIKEVLESSRPAIKQIANFISAKSCPSGNRVCQSKGLFYFVRDEILYVPDPEFHDELENPLITLKTGGADCEDKAVLLVALEKAIGNAGRLVGVPGHAYAQISIPGYRNGNWIGLDPTCADCDFAELPDASALGKKTYNEI
jgi:hypothetical protein